jgi:uncharacterized protein YkwD
MTWQRLRRGRTARGLLIVGSVLGVIAAGLAAVPDAGAGTEEGTPIAGAGGRCVDVSWSQRWNGAPIHLFDCNGTAAQKWTFNRETTSVEAFGKCLDVADASHDDGAAVRLWDCNGTGAQQWRAGGTKLINTGSGKCLDAHGGSTNQTPLQIWTCADSPTQAWKLPNGEPDHEPAGAATKKGVSTWAFPRVADGVREVQAAWYYDWSPDNADVPAQAEFVPMIWGSGAVNDADLATAKRSGTSLLGFNEPDRTDQANLSVDQALALWPRLEQTGLRLGSPAVAGGADLPGGWLDRFLTGARERGLRVDFITLHWYGADFSDAAADQFMGYVEAVHKRYDRPIWITEFGLINFTGAPRYPSAEQVTTFIGRARTSLEEAAYVERYAWFGLPAVGDSAEFGLYREDGTTTPAGVAYRDAQKALPVVPEEVRAAPEDVAAVPEEERPQPAAGDGPADRMIELINVERSRAGCPAVTKNAALTTAATAHSQLMADRRDLNHRLPGEADLGDRFTAAGYRWSGIAENIAPGAFATPEIAMYGKHDATTDFTGFMESEGHRANILNCGYREVGVGVVRDTEGGPWWTQDFGSPS